MTRMMRPNFVLAAGALACLGSVVLAQTPAPSHPAVDRDTIVKAASRVIAEARYCALITIDDQGQPHARVVDAFGPEDNFVVWIGTNAASRKISQIKRNPRVTLYYFDPKDPGYVTLLGRAEVVDAPAEKAKRWKEEWASFFANKNQGTDYVLIKVTPFRLEAVSYSMKVLNDPKSWTVPSIALP